MNLLLCAGLLLLWWTAPSIEADDTSFSTANAQFRCGIRKKFGVQLNQHGRTTEQGQWPWHAALYHGAEYKCGGTLIDQRHILTSAYCLVDSHRRPMKPNRITIKLGTNNLNESSKHAQVYEVSEVHVHPEFSGSRYNIGLVVLKQTVRFSELVIPICIVGIQAENGDYLVDQRGWVAGFGETETERYSTMLKTASMTVVSNTQCILSDPSAFDRLLTPAVFCAGDNDGMSVCRGDGGGGMYILAGDHWELHGMITIGILSEKGTCDASKYMVFTNVAFYYQWIKQKTGIGGRVIAIPRRISETKCREYSRFAAKRKNGICYNAHSPHTVAIINANQRHISSGSIVSERFILTTAPTLLDIFATNVAWDELFVRIGNHPNKRVIREITHPDIDPTTLRHHLMLLELDSPLTFSNQLVPVCLANLATENLYDTLLLNGYSGQSALTNDFYESVENRVISNEQCNGIVKTAHKRYTVNREELCTTDRHEGFFVRDGIIGGPLQTVNTRSCMFTQVGVTKFLIPHNWNQKVNQTIHFTNVYSRVTAYLDWIEQEVWGKQSIPMDYGLIDHGGEAPTIIDDPRQ